MRKFLARAGAVVGVVAAGSLIPASAAHADVIGIGDVDVYAPINVLIQDVINCLSVVIG